MRSLAHVGETKAGVPVYLNKRWLGADVRITTGFVEPHFFAGFSGGPKMVAPGLAGLKTVLVLHDATRIGSPNATWGVIEGNPIQDDVREIARMTGVTFSIDVTLNRDQQITAVFAGELFAEHAQACAAAKSFVMRAVDAPFDVVLTTNSGYPLDQNLYQAVKGMSAAAKVIKPGGTIICAAECRDGLPNHGSYGAVLASQPSPKALLEMIHGPGYAVPDAWQVQIQAQIQMNAKVLVKNGFMPPAAIRAAHFEPIDDVAASACDALQCGGPHRDAVRAPAGTADDSLPAVGNIRTQNDERRARSYVLRSTILRSYVLRVHVATFHVLRRRLDPQQRSLIFVRQHIQEPVGSLADVADALPHFHQDLLAADFFPLLVEHDALDMPGAIDLALAHAPTNTLFFQCGNLSPV